MSNLSQFFGGGSKFQIFTSSGTWVCPAANTKVHVLCIGGGGRGGFAGGGITIAGTSSFGALVIATGGVSGSPASGVTGGGGGTSGYCSGKSGTNSIATYQIGTGGKGGEGAFGFGSGGNGAESDSTYVGGSGGGASGFIETYSGTVSTNQTVTIGAGTAVAASRSTSGSNGAVLVWWE